MIVYVLFAHKKSFFKEKSLNYFHKKLKIKKIQKKHFLCFFLVFLGGFFIANPAWDPGRARPAPSAAPPPPARRGRTRG
jgi:hypothetical protein